MKIIPIFLFVFLLSSCDILNSCLEGNGKPSSEARAISSFTNIYNGSGIDVTIIYDEAQTSLTVEADENLQQYIKTYVNSSSLIIEVDEDRCLESVNPMKITVRCSGLESTVVSGSGDIDLYGFKTDNFSAKSTGSGDLELNDFIIQGSMEIISSGSGDITIDGKGNNATCLLSGSGDIDADRFKVDNCTVALSGSGNMSVYFISNLSGTITGSGDIHYYGSSSLVQVRVTGSGKLIEE